MRKWYCVVSTFDDKGRVTANIVDTKEADEQLESTSKSTKRKDVYTDWFDSEETANKFIADSKNA